MGGYIREMGLSMCAIATACVVAFSWWGVTLLGVGLHSYGFTSGIWTATYSFWGTQGLRIGLGIVVLMRVRMGGTAAVPESGKKSGPEALAAK
jgi:hypothetical protein